MANLLIAFLRVVLGEIMAYGGYSYIDRSYKPSKDDFIVLFWVSGSEPVENLAEALAAESSVGTWTKLKTMKDKIWKKLRARVFRIDRVSDNSGFVSIAYPLEHFDKKNIIQFQASVLGNVFGLKELRGLFVLDISFPEKFQKQFPGPRAGLEGIRKYAGTSKNRRPHLGTIAKPKVGLTPSQFSELAYDAYSGGCDFLKDDENLVDQPFCRFEKRVSKMLEVTDRIKSEGRKVLYAPNISDRYSRAVERIDFLAEQGANTAMVDVYVTGYSALQDILEILQKKKMFVHAHRAGYAALSRGRFGISFTVHEKFYRLLGVDQLHIGTGVGKMEGSILYIKMLHDVATLKSSREKMYVGALKTKWARSIKPLMPVASGGVDPGLVAALLELHGKEVTVQAGGGIHGHPKGTKAGARAMRQAIDAVVSGMSPLYYAKMHEALAIALNKWGYTPPNRVKKVLAEEKKNRKTLNKRALSKGLKEVQR